MSEVTILIRTLNEGEHLAKTLSKIVDQSVVPDDIVIVDSYSEDDTVKIARSFGATVKQISREEFTYGKGLNVGLELSNSQYVASISAHAVPEDRHWLQNLLESVQADSVAGAYGRQIAGQNAHSLERRELLANYGDSPREQRDDPYFSNANSIIDRSVWRKFNFDEQLPASEDRKWALKVQNEGFVIRYNSDATVIHTHNDTLPELFKRNYNEGKAMQWMNEDSSVDLLTLFGGTLLSSYSDIRYILEEGGNPWYLFYSPVYRFTQNIGRLMGYYEI